MNEPFWEQAYAAPNADAFSKGPTGDLKAHVDLLKPRARVLDVGCGEGRNAIFLAARGHVVDAFDISAAGVASAKRRAAEQRLDIRFWLEDLAGFTFLRNYDAILSHGVLHLPEKAVRDAFLKQARAHTKPGGLHFIGIFTNRLPAAPDMRPFTKSLFDVGELPAQYAGWDIFHHDEGTFHDEHPGGLKHEHAYERIVARKPEFRLIKENKRDYMPLLLLADEDERMIARYLDRGDLFALYLGEELAGASVVTDEGDGVLELQNVAVTENRQRQGWGVRLVKFLLRQYRGKGKTMIVGTGNVPSTVQFYRYCGFKVSHYLHDYFVQHYDHPMYEDGVQLRDKVYLTIELGE